PAPGRGRLGRRLADGTGPGRPRGGGRRPDRRERRRGQQGRHLPARRARGPARRSLLHRRPALHHRSRHARRLLDPDRGARSRRGGRGRRGLQPGVRRAPGRAGHGDRDRGRGARAALSRIDREGAPRVSDADAMLSAARRPLVLGIGGGGDVVGALATAEACRTQGAEPVVGGVTWERRPIDPVPGPRSGTEIEGARRLAPGVLAATGSTRVRESGVLFAESRMADLLGEETVLVDATLGPAAIADGLEAAAAHLGADLIVFVDVGGDVLAHGDEPGLASPLCDAIMLAAAARVWKARTAPVLGGIFGVGCDGELTPAEVLERLAEVAEAGGFAGARGLTPAIAARLAEAVAAVPTEASAQALACFHGGFGETT